MSTRRNKLVNKTFTIANGTAAGDQTFSFVTDKGYGHVEAVAFSERTNGRAAGLHPYLLGLKETNGEKVLFDPVPKALVLASSEDNTQNFLPFQDRFYKMGTQMEAAGKEYTITVRTTLACTEDLVIDVTFKHANFQVNE